MTRKRFVKLCMARGHSRNEANLIAEAVVRAGATYENGYFAVRLDDGDSEAVEALHEACIKIVRGIKAIVEAAFRAVKAIDAAVPSMAAMGRIDAPEE